MIREQRQKLYTVTPQTRARILDLLSTEVARERQIIFAYVYGSLLERDRIHDVDLGIYLDPQPSAAKEDYALKLAERLSHIAEIPVDVRVLNEASDSFVYHVLRGQLLHYRDEDLLSDVIERTAARYLDIAPLMRHSTKEAFAS